MTVDRDEGNDYAAILIGEGKLEFQDLQRNVHLLANLEEGEEPLVNCYLNLDTRYREQFNERIRSLGSRIERSIRPAFWEAIGRIEVFIGTGIRPESKGAAVFCRCGNRPLFLALQFGAPLPNSVTASPLPHIYHLAALRDNYFRYVVMLSSEAVARILEVNLGTITETIRKERTELSGRASRDWTKVRHQSRRREQTRRFINDQVRTLQEVMSAKGYRYFFLTGEPWMTAQIQRALPKHLSSMLVGVIHASASDRSADLVTATRQPFIEFENRESLAVVDRLRAEMNGRGFAVAGTTDCFRAVMEDRAGMLVLSSNFAPDPAWLCLSCEERMIAPGIPYECAACKGHTFRELDTREEIVRLAERSGRPIEIVEHSAGLEAIGGIGCFLRYQALERFERPVA